MDFGKKLKLLLEYEGIKHKDFAAMLHISPSTLNGYLNCGKQPPFELVKTIASTLNVSTDYLLDFNSDKTGSPPVSVSELAMLTRLRSLSKQERETIYKLVEMLSEKSGKN
ncbi:MAG: helix-turn-helix transcriptional regulator [Oscillospiraceae bacterium]|nr:helix-turn-helix transcriptional regulator [Oscillospiraceae bacterium]